MSDTTQGRTFISCSRKDGAEFAAWLRGWLQKRNLSAWQVDWGPQNNTSIGR
jgi:hypothetical protein